MTLSTNVYFTTFVEPEALMDFVNEELLHATDPKIERTETSIGNELGQGFDAWASIEHNKGEKFVHKPWMSDEWYAENPDDLAREIARFDEAEGKSYVRLNFDTAYGYSDNGMGCGALHASYIAKLYAYYHMFSLTEKDGTVFFWRNEFTDDVFENVDGLETLDEGGREAESWFKEMVLPAFALDRLPEGRDKA